MDQKLKENLTNNFGELVKAIQNEDVALLEAKHKDTGEKHLLIAIAVQQGDMMYMLPIARMLEESPFESYEPPADVEQMAVEDGPFTVRLEDPEDTGRKH
jgi:hypothetical protein